MRPHGRGRRVSCTYGVVLGSWVRIRRQKFPRRPGPCKNPYWNWLTNYELVEDVQFCGQSFSFRKVSVAGDLHEVLTSSTCRLGKQGVRACAGQDGRGFRALLTVCCFRYDQSYYYYTILYNCIRYYTIVYYITYAILYYAIVGLHREDGKAAAGGGRSWADYRKIYSQPPEAQAEMCVHVYV